jgi:polar amino acid transport system substrate-binding protein
MMKTFAAWQGAALLVVVVAAGGCTPNPASTLDRILARGELVVGVKEDSPPFGFHQGGELWGFDVDLARKIADKLGVKLRLVPVTTANRVKKLMAEEVDVLAASMTHTRTRDRDTDFSMDYFATEQAFLVKADSPVRGYVDLAGKKVGAARGSTAIGNLKVVQPDAMAVAYEDYDKAFKALESGEVDAMTTDYIILVGLMRDQGGKYKVVGQFGHEPYGIAMRQNDSKLRGRIDDILQEMWDEGSLQRIYDNWFGEHGRFPAKITFTMTTYPKGQ